MDVYEAVDSRRAVRAFSDEPVPKEMLERVLAAATRPPLYPADLTSPYLDRFSAAATQRYQALGGPAGRTELQTLP